MLLQIRDILGVGKLTIIRNRRFYRLTFYKKDLRFVIVPLIDPQVLYFK